MAHRADKDMVHRADKGMAHKGDTVCRAALEAATAAQALLLPGLWAAFPVWSAEPPALGAELPAWASLKPPAHHRFPRCWTVFEAWRVLDYTARSSPERFFSPSIKIPPQMRLAAKPYPNFMRRGLFQRRRMVNYPIRPQAFGLISAPSTFLNPS